MYGGLMNKLKDGSRYNYITVCRYHLPSSSHIPLPQRTLAINLLRLISMTVLGQPECFPLDPSLTVVITVLSASDYMHTNARSLEHGRSSVIGNEIVRFSCPLEDVGDA